MVCDPYWRESFDTGEIIEEITLRGSRTVFIRGTSATGRFQYPFRAFFFQKDSKSPGLILSLEIGLRFGTCALGAHTLTEHINYGPADPDMVFDDFRSWALATAEQNFF